MGHLFYLGFDGDCGDCFDDFGGLIDDGGDSVVDGRLGGFCSVSGAADQTSHHALHFLSAGDGDLLDFGGNDVDSSVRSLVNAFQCRKK